MQIPDKNCPICPRLKRFREENRLRFPSYYNAPVPSFGALDAELLIVGLAPGLHGANQTGRPFTGDYAGIVLYGSLLKYGFAEGNYNPPAFCHASEGWHPEQTPQQVRGDTLKLKNCRITNAVRCVPQENKPEPSEIKNCNAFLQSEIAAMPNLRAILSLGLISHNAVLRALGHKAGAAKFVHGATYQVPSIKHQAPLNLYDSYHCSRYNINTGRLTQAMFDAVVAAIARAL